MTGVKPRAERAVAGANEPSTIVLFVFPAYGQEIQTARYAGGR